MFSQHPQRGRLVSAVSPLAARDGIVVDMPISEAKSLLRRSAQKSSASFHVLEHDRAAEHTALEELADSLTEFSPIIGLEQTAQSKTAWPSSIFLDVTGLAHLFGTERRLAESLLQHCQSAGYLARAAIANTIGLACGVAQFGTDTLDPDSPAMLVPETSKASDEALGQLPVRALRLTPTTNETLEQLGIYWTRQLIQLSRADLAMRFGDEISSRLDQALGVLDEPIVARHAPPEFQAEKLLDYPTRDRETIEVILSRLVAEICKQMKARQQGALQWTVRLQLQEGSPLDFRVNLFQPTATVEHVMQLAQMQLEQILQPHLRKRRSRSRRFRTEVRPNAPQNLSQKNLSQNTPNPQPSGSEKTHKRRETTTFQVCEIGVSVTSCVTLAERQRQLFDENPRLDKLSLAHLINRLTSRLGQENVVYPTLQSGAQPEYAFRLRPLVDPRRRRNRRTAKPKNLSHVMGRPLRLLNPPIEIDSQSVERLPSQKIRRPPALLVYDGCHQKIVRTWGPERIETGWWRGPTTRRDYWRIETETNQQFWIYRNLRNQKWFLQGEF